jgi:hypothetical protein
MATVMQLHWPEATREQYDKTRVAVDLDGDPPEGAQLHMAWFGDDGLHVVDLWDSPEAFQSYAETRLMPAVARVGIQGEPTVSMSGAHTVYAWRID